MRSFEKKGLVIPRWNLQVKCVTGFTRDAYRYGTHFHIAPSELNTPVPNNGSINFLDTEPNKALPERVSARGRGITEETFLIVIEVGRKDELRHRLVSRKH